MARYASAPDPEAFYVWDERLQKSLLVDVAHVEVLLRNFISERLAADCLRTEGSVEWYDQAGRYNLNIPLERSVSKAKARIARDGGAVSYDRVIAALSFDFWRFLLVRRLEPTVWRALRDRANGGMPNHPGTSRADFEDHVVVVYNLRNRCSHQEHLVQDSIEEEGYLLDRAVSSIDWVARKIDPEAADWIRGHSTVAEVRMQRPRANSLLPSGALPSAR